MLMKLEAVVIYVREPKYQMQEVVLRNPS